jgi:flavin reductase (DIM6/NTAB) family NADH-FMN oxidoreductase RutF
MILKNFKRESMIPLPVAFISTISEDGVRNIAPYSCVMPVLRPFDLVCVASAATMRHTLDNIRSTGEFVLNMPGVDMVESVIPTAKFSSPETDEFELAGLEEKHSKTIKTPGINGCYAWMECQLYREFEDEYNGFPYTLIIGKVTYLEIEDNVYNPEDGSWDVEKAKPLMMTGSDRGMHFCTIKDINKFEPFGAMFPGGKDPLEGMYK